jgi:rare lipoprotein A
MALAAVKTPGFRHRSKSGAGGALIRAGWMTGFAYSFVTKEPANASGKRGFPFHLCGRWVLLAAASLLLANCSAGTQRVASSEGGIDPKYGVKASPRVVADGAQVPKGGGRAMVGKPYVVAGKTYTPRENPDYSATGIASWYGAAFHGRLTANGEVFDRQSISAAHPTLPLPSYVRVTNLSNGYSIVARVNDRGPYHGGRVIDVSQSVAEALEFKHLGTARVKVDYVRKANVAGSDDRMLMASLRTDGGPANLNGSIVPVMIAQKKPEPVLSPRQVAFMDEPEAEPVAAPPRVAYTAPTAGVQVAALHSIGTPAPGIPLPPDRPFDLGGGAPRSAPMGQAPVPGGRSVSSSQRSAALYYAEAEGASTGFRHQDPMALLIAQTFVPLRASAQGF